MYQAKYIVVLIFVFAQSYGIGENCGTGWTAFVDTKCYRVINKLETEAQALLECNSLEEGSTLATIDTKEQQAFVVELVKQFKSQSDDIWIGLNMVNNVYKWVDGNSLNYTNWNNQADKTEKCVVMSITDHSLGQWKDESCTKTSFPLCQKKQTSLTVVMQELNKIKKLLDSQQDATVPIGFIYTQLSGQMTPHDLWPRSTWVDVTSQYAGLFFRAEGGGSASFGQVQIANQSRISHFKVTDMKRGTENVKNVEEVFELNEGSWSKVMPSGNALDYFYVYTTTGENRPKNTAIRFWKRTK